MYDKFGEFDSMEELNRAAAAQKAEGDEEALKLLALENGLDEEDAEDYMDGVIENLAVTPLMAAAGKIKVESEDLKVSGILSDWAQEIYAECVSNVDLARAVRRKGKSLAGYIALLAEDGFKNRCNVDKRIVDQTVEVKKVCGNHGLAIGVPDKATRRKLMLKYYIGK